MEMSAQVPSLNRPTLCTPLFKWTVARKHVHNCLCISSTYYYYYHNKLAIGRRYSVCSYRAHNNGNFEFA